LESSFRETLSPFLSPHWQLSKIKIISDYEDLSFIIGTLLLHPYMVKGTNLFSWTSLVRALIPLMRSSPSWVNHHSIDLTLYHLSDQALTYEFGEWNINIEHSTADLGNNDSCDTCMPRWLLNHSGEQIMKCKRWKLKIRNVLNW
jgi:hypothetical protein